MLRSKFFFILVLLSISFLGFSGFTYYEYRKTIHSDLCSISNVSFRGGETIVYKAYYNWQFVWIPAGEAVFEVKEDADYYEIFIQGKSYPSYDGFFRLNDKFYSKIHKHTLYPRVFERSVEEGDYRKYEKIIFNQKSNKATVLSGRSKESAKKDFFEFDDCMHDLVSLLYFMRNIDVAGYKEGDYIPTNIFFDRGIFPVKVRYGGKEKNKEIKDFGHFNSILVIPDLIAGNIFNEGDLMNVWVSDDTNKVPLLVETPLKVGHLKAVLKSHKGLRNNLSSKIK